MTFLHDLSLVAKVLLSAGTVIGLTVIAERVSTRIAGILSGAPLNTAFLYLFVGLDMGKGYVIESVPHGIVSFSGTLVFIICYYYGSRFFTRFSVAITSIVATAAFVAVGFVLAAVPFSLTGATITTACTAAFALWMFRHVTFVKIDRPVSYTPTLLILRGGGAGLLIVAVATIATVLGPSWTGVLAGFPATLLPTLLIMHTTYGTASAHAIIKNFPVGMGSIILYIFSATVTFPFFGVVLGTIVSLLISALYLSALVVWTLTREAKT